MPTRKPSAKEISAEFLSAAQYLDRDHSRLAWETFPHSAAGDAAWHIFDLSMYPSDGPRRGAPAVLACLFLSHMHHEL
jgi:hypothetical protein